MYNAGSRLGGFAEAVWDFVRSVDRVQIMLDNAVRVFNSDV
jgi:hypothetical protein